MGNTQNLQGGNTAIKHIAMLAGLMIFSCFLMLLGVFMLYAPSTLLYAGQPLETETARLLKARSFKIENTFEYQTSSEGTEINVPFVY